MEVPCQKNGALARLEKEHREAQAAAPPAEQAAAPKMEPRRDWVASFTDVFGRVRELLPPTEQESVGVDHYLDRLRAFVAGKEYMRGVE